RRRERREGEGGEGREGGGRTALSRPSLLSGGFPSGRMALPFKTSLLDTPRLQMVNATSMRRIIAIEGSLKEYTPFAIVPVILVLSILSLLLLICKLYQWNLQRTQYEYLGRIYDILEEASPLDNWAERDYKSRYRLHKAVSIPCEPSPFFQPRRSNKRSATTLHVPMHSIFHPSHFPGRATHI
ncbi:hypothetical protein PENTCL1PPCAC_18158, partial [Pristionchus entomophagus]